MKTYDPSQVVATVGGRPLAGFAPGTFIEAERAEDAYSMTVGIDGEGTRSKSNNKSGTVKFTLLSSSDSNDILSGFAAADELNNGGLVPVLIKDLSGRALIACEQAYVKKLPILGFDNEVREVEWILETDNLALFLGGN